MSIIDTIAAVTANEALAIDPSQLTAERGHAVVSKSNCQTTTELLALLALFSADVDDHVGAKLLADFAAVFATHEASVV